MNWYMYHIPDKSYANSQWDYAKDMKGSMQKKEFIGVLSEGGTIFRFAMPIDKFMNNIDQFHGVYCSKPYRTMEGSDTHHLMGWFIKFILTNCKLVVYDREFPALEVE